MEYILNDRSTYKKLNKDPNYIQIFKHHERELPRCYGLSKIHKTGFPLRIIVSSMSSPLCNISKYKYIFSLGLHSLDGWSFAAICYYMKDKLINDDEIIISFDVIALFTNIPKELVLRAIEKRWNDIAPNTKFNLSQFLYAVEVILDSTSFSFNGKFYEQIFGSPMLMGVSVITYFSRYWMDDLETHCLSSLGFTVSVYYRYIDDIFRYFRFMYQFLNTSVIRSNGKIVTNWYRKPTFFKKRSGRERVNFYSNHPFKYKINTIFNLVDHAILLSDDQFHGKNIDVLKQILFNNCFPIHIINHYIYKRLNFLKYRVNSIPCNGESSTDKPFYIALPFVESLSDNIDRLFKNMGFTVVYNIPKKLNSLIKRGKDGLPISNRTEVVYKINCKNCSAYIGQTKTLERPGQGTF
ncbi:hypothetical protein ACFW04_012819 [Cataglyphis niger]